MCNKKIRNMHMFSRLQEIAIFKKYSAGTPTIILADQYSCSANTIRKVVRRCRDKQGEIL